MPKPQHDFESLYDCIVIGAGPAGLTCAIFLGRYRRRVLVIDSNRPRNYASRGIHGFLGQSGITPAELHARGCAEAEEVGVEFIESEASKVERCGDYFEVTTQAGVAKGRRVVLAYGVRDTLPEIDRFDEFYGASIHHCPDCDGYEVSDLTVGVIGWGKRVAGLTLRLLQWTSDLTIFTDGHEPDIAAEEKSKLLAEGINVRGEKIVKLIGTDGRLRAIELEGGDRIPLDAMFFTIGVKRSCILAEDLGCEAFDELNLVVDEYKQTTIPGVYAIGDLVAGSQLAITSAADGAVAAIAINKDLLPPAKRV